MLDVDVSLVLLFGGAGGLVVQNPVGALGAWGWVAVSGYVLALLDAVLRKGVDGVGVVECEFLAASGPVADGCLAGVCDGGGVGQYLQVRELSGIGRCCDGLLRRGNAGCLRCGDGCESVAGVLSNFGEVVGYVRAIGELLQMLAGGVYRELGECFCSLDGRLVFLIFETTDEASEGVGPCRYGGDESCGGGSVHGLCSFVLSETGVRRRSWE